MRIIGYIEHPELKITVFKMNNKISVKFESELLEQTYKFRTSSLLDKMENVQKLVDPPFIDEVEKEMLELKKIRSESLVRRIQEIEKQEEFDEII